LKYVLTPLGESQPLPNSPRRLRELIPPGHSINVFARPQ
jgi:hypothetical protein